MKRYVACIAIFIPLSIGTLDGITSRPRSSPANGEQKAPAPRRNPSSDAGEEVFMANCARCHMPPMSIPQRVTGTVIMHMRVRARLSRQDEQLLLKYMAP